MYFLRKIVEGLKDLSPAKREIIVIAIILCIAVILSIPQYFPDVEAAKQQQVELQSDTSFPTAKPEDQGMDSVRLETASEQLESTSALSFLVVRNGSLVFEKYYEYQGNDAQTRYNVYSITKSFTSALIGIAIREGYIGGVNDPVEKYLPEYFKGPIDPRWRKITLKHLLTMTPGFCEDLTMMLGSSDWIQYTFDLPLKYDPGKEFQYANSASHLLSVILTRSTGMSTKAFAEKYLFKPIGIMTPEWETDPGGCYTGYAGIYLTPRNLIKFGWLYCCRGKWQGRQIVPEDWVEESAKIQFDLNKGSNNGEENGYGYKWWISNKTGYHTFSALGYGGQSITVFPDLELVVVITCAPGTLSLTDEQREKFLKEYVITSIADKEGGKQDGTVGNQKAG